MGFFFPLIMMLTWMVSVAGMVRKLVYEREIRLEEVGGLAARAGGGGAGAEPLCPWPRPGVPASPEPGQALVGVSYPSARKRETHAAESGHRGCWLQIVPLGAQRPTSRSGVRVEPSTHSLAVV